MHGVRVTRAFLPPITYEDQVLTLNADDLSTEVRTCTLASTCHYQKRPFNFADLKGQIPASVYFARASSVIFNGRPRRTIVDGNYWPRVLLPMAITSIAPNLLASCPVKFTESFISEMDGAERTGVSYIGMWDPPVELQAITETAPAPAPIITSDQIPNPEAAVEGELPALLHTPASTAPGAPTATTIAFKTTATALPDWLIAALGTRTVLPSGSALTLGDAVVSRRGIGDYVIESLRVYDLRGSRTGRRESPTGWGWKGDQTVSGDSGKRKSGAVRGIAREMWLRWVCVGFLGALWI